MTTKEAAVILGINHWSVSKAIKRGTISAQKIKGLGQGGFQYDISPEEVNRYRRQRERRG